MNIIEQETLKEVITNPQTVNEALLVERLKELETAAREAEKETSFEDDQDLVHDTESAKVDIARIKTSLELIRPMVSRIDSEWFNGPDSEDMPDKDSQPLEWLCVELANLENDDHCLAGYVLSFAERSIDKVETANSYLFNALN